MATKKATKSASKPKAAPAKKAPAKKVVAKKPAVAAKPKAEAKVDQEFNQLVAEMQKSAVKTETPKKKKKAWGTIIVTTILVLLLVWLGTWICGVVQQKKIEKDLPTIINYLGGGEMAFKEITSIKKADGVFEFEFTFEEYPDEPFISYITKGGKIFFVSGYMMEDLQAEMDANGGSMSSGEATLTCESVPKAAAPELTAYIVADCPYGTQMQSVMADAIATAPEIASNFNVRYFFDQITADGLTVTAMHGDAEAKENLRQICIREEQPTAFWDYVSCYAAGGATATCQTQTGINTANIEACMTSPSRGIAYGIEDNELAMAHMVSGSPTLVINDETQISEFDFGGRNAESLKSIVCCSADGAFPFCTTAMSVDAAGVSGEC